MRQEAGSGVIVISGTVGGDVKDGDTVTLTYGSVTHTGQVDAKGEFSIYTSGIDLAKVTSISASVSTTDAAGNTATSTAAQTYSVDTTATAGVTVDSITQAITFIKCNRVRNKSKCNRFSKWRCKRWRHGYSTRKWNGCNRNSIGR